MAHIDPEWLFKQRVVALLEKALDPAATVEHDVRLPELVGGGLRQCDVAIYAGTPERQTMTIVEVQKRTSKPDINTFDGWCSKRDKLGAQHLICVSAEGFPKSILESAKRQGNSVRLVTLGELESAQWPIYVTENKVRVRLVERNVTEAHALPDDSTAEAEELDVVGDEGTEGGRVCINDRWFSFKEIADSLIQRNGLNPYQLEMGSHDFEWGLSYSSMLVRINRERVIPAKHLLTVVNLKVAVLEIPVAMEEYRQEGVPSPLAYTLTGRTNYEGRDVQAKMVFRPAGDGMLELAEHKLTGFGVDPQALKVTSRVRTLLDS